MASFAVDGGLIVVGLAEDKERRTFDLRPVALAGLAERVDQVARSSIDPPLPVGTAEIPASGREGHGYLLITVPASPLAPHMVDGQYRGRGDTTNLVLTDAEVRRLHDRARLTRDLAVELLRGEIARDPSPLTEQPEAHLFVVAQPVAADPELLFRSVGESGLAGWVRDRVLSGLPCARAGTAFGPDLGSTATDISRRADGVALATYQLGPGRVPRPNGDHPPEDTDLLELEVREDGGLRLFCGRASDSIQGKRVAIEVLIGGLTYRTLLTAAEVMSSTGYGGSWDLGLAVTNLHGCHGFLLHDTFGAEFLDVPYSSDTYEQVVRVEGAAIVEKPAEVLKSLYGRLYRGLSGGAKSIEDLIAPIVNL